MLRNLFKHIGPGTLVAAAFIGPGTITVCTIAGVSFGFGLLWAIFLSIIATLVLQEMVSRLGIITQKGLSEVIKGQIQNPFLRRLIIGLILSAIVIGNAAYEAGNISGSGLGLEAIFGDLSYKTPSFTFNGSSLIIGSIAFLILWIGNYKALERILVSLVLLMSVSFVITALMTKPNLVAVFKGIVLPSFSKDSILTIVALIGTTVVPYNLFLHAALVKEKWKSANDLPKAKKDTLISIVLGGLVSMAVLVSAAAIPSKEITNAIDLAKALTPLYGEASRYFLGIGLFAAGITSAVTAPLAAAYVAKECFDIKGGLQSTGFRAVWMSILFIGVFISSLGLKPIDIIKFAQFANGLVLPILAIILIWVMNKQKVLGNYVNSKFQNAIAMAIVLLTVFLGGKGILSVFNVL